MKCSKRVLLIVCVMAAIVSVFAGAMGLSSVQAAGWKILQAESCSASVVTVPSGSSLERKLRFDSDWVISRKGRRLRLLIDGLSISRETFEIPALQFTP